MHCTSAHGVCDGVFMVVAFHETLAPHFHMQCRTNAGPNHEAGKTLLNAAESTAYIFVRKLGVFGGKWAKGVELRRARGFLLGGDSDCAANARCVSLKVGNVEAK